MIECPCGASEFKGCSTIGCPLHFHSLEASKDKTVTNSSPTVKDNTEQKHWGKGWHGLCNTIRYEGMHMLMLIELFIVCFIGMAVIGFIGIVIINFFQTSQRG